MHPPPPPLVRVVYYVGLYPASPLPGSSYWLLMMWGNDIIFLGESPREKGEGGGGLYSSRHLPCIIKVGAKTASIIPCTTLYRYRYSVVPPSRERF